MAEHIRVATECLTALLQSPEAVEARDDSTDRLTANVPLEALHKIRE